MTDFQEEWKFYKETNCNRLGKQVYYVSNYGNVLLNDKPYKCHIHNGYKYLPNGVLLHRVVAELFIPNPYNLPYVDHIDTNKLNNIATGEKINLRWCTPKQNSNNPLTIKHNSAGQTRNTGKYVWVNNKIIQKKVLKENLNEYLDNGYKLGRLEIKRNEKGQFTN